MSIKISSNGSRVCRNKLGTRSLVYSSIPQQGMTMDARPERAETGEPLVWDMIFSS
jgi:hypothetical protein